ncbi:MAG: hypothetical protein JWR22_4324 [Herminiimonas sp.]|nr:hypothetical protein [Herminiimonas sp.]
MTSSTLSVGHLVSVIQDRLAARASTSSAAPTRTRASRPAKAPAELDLESLIGLRIRSIASDDPWRGRKAFRIFLESTLLARLGKELMHDPKFYELVENVQSDMEKDENIDALVKAAMAHLLSDEVKQRG